MRTLMPLTFLAILLLPAVLAEIKPLVLVGCFDAQLSPPIFCSNYTKELVDLASDSLKANYGEGIEVKGISDWFFMLDAITMPNVIGAIISVREGLFKLQELRQEEIVTAFEDGLGLVGMHALGYEPFSGRLSQEVFPLNGNKTATGKVHREKVITSRHTHRKYTDHPITSRSPEMLEIPDGALIYKAPVTKDWWTPQEGNMTVLYVSTTASKAGEVPSIVLYERGSGRSVIFAGLRHTDAPGRYEKDLSWYNHSLPIPGLRQLLKDSLLYVLEPFADPDSVEARMKESRLYFEERFGALEEEMRMGEEAQSKRRRDAFMATALTLALSAAAVLVIGYLGLVRHS